tara:strand:+ start:520 stop:1470 length:951 start_codon:yes stop_codon:yes gene_type:complete
MFKITNILVIFISLTFCQNNIGAKFLLIPPGAKATSLGNAQVASPGDIFSPFWNPASLMSIKKTTFGLVHFKWFPNLANDMYYNFLGFNHSFKNAGSIGGHLIHLNLGSQLHTGNAKDDILGSFQSFMNAVVISYAKSYSKKLSYGVNIRWFHQHLFNINSDLLNSSAISNSYNFDIGILLNQIYNEINLGLTIKHLGSEISFSSDDKQLQPLMATVGIFAPIVKLKKYHSFILYDLQYTKSNGGVVSHSVGLENKLFNQFLLRVGYNINGLNDLNNLSIGSGFNINNFIFDFSILFGKTDNFINNTFQFSLQYEI